MRAATIHMPKVLRQSKLNITIQVTGRREYAVRLWLGCLILRLAARIIGCSIVIEMDNERDDVIVADTFEEHRPKHKGGFL